MPTSRQECSPDGATERLVLAPFEASVEWDLPIEHGWSQRDFHERLAWPPFLSFQFCGDWDIASVSRTARPSAQVFLSPRTAARR